MILADRYPTLQQSRTMESLFMSTVALPDSQPDFQETFVRNKTSFQHTTKNGCIDITTAEWDHYSERRRSF